MPHLNQRPEWEKLFQEIKLAHPDWEWNDLDGRGFYELSQCYRLTPLVPQTDVVDSFEVIKCFIRTLLLTEHARWVKQAKEQVTHALDVRNPPDRIDSRCNLECHEVMLGEVLRLPFLSQEPNV